MGDEPAAALRAVSLGSHMLPPDQVPNPRHGWILSLYLSLHFKFVHFPPAEVGGFVLAKVLHRPPGEPVMAAEVSHSALKMGRGSSQPEEDGKDEVGKCRERSACWPGGC